MPAPKIVWTDEMRLKIATMYKLEGKSAREIADKMGGGITKNMVLGQLFHMGSMRSGKAANGQSQREPKQRSTYPKREKVEPVIVNEMWSMEENERRRAFARRAAKGARQMLREMQNG